MKRRLTCRRGFDRYKSDGLVCAIQLDHVEADEVEHAVITESDERWIDDIGRTIIRQRRDSHYLVGEIANRLYEYEQLGYFPEELKEIIRCYKAYRLTLNSCYGKTGDVDVDPLYPHIFMHIARQNGKTLMQAKMIEELIKNDPESAKRYLNSLYGVKKNGVEITYAHPEEHLIENVIFNDPATIVFWADGTKTVVKADKEEFDPEKGLAMAISKKILGNKGNYFDIFKKWIKKYKPSPSKAAIANVGDAAKGFADGMRHAAEAARKLAKETRDDAIEGNVFLASDELRSALNRKKTTKSDMMDAMRYALERLDYVRLHFIKKKEN